MKKVKTNASSINGDEVKRRRRPCPTPPHQLHKDGKSALLPVWSRSEWVHARVDLADLERLLNYKWRLDGDGYVVTSVYDTEAKRATHLALHRMVTHAPAGVIVDHRWRNKLDARRIALRFATHQQNAVNRRRARRNFLSKYRGVTYHAATRKWQAQVKKDGKFVYGGLHETERQAACAYNVIAKQAHGRFAVLNPITCSDVAAGANQVLLSIKKRKAA